MIIEYLFVHSILTPQTNGLTLSTNTPTHTHTPFVFVVTQFRAALFLRAGFEMPSFSRFICPLLHVREINNQSISSDPRHHSPLKSHTPPAHTSPACAFPQHRMSQTKCAFLFTCLVFAIELYRVFLFLLLFFVFITSFI